MSRRSSILFLIFSLRSFSLFARSIFDPESSFFPLDDVPACAPFDPGSPSMLGVRLPSTRPRFFSRPPSRRLDPPCCSGCAEDSGILALRLRIARLLVGTPAVARAGLRTVILIPPTDLFSAVPFFKASLAGFAEPRNPSAPDLRGRKRRPSDQIKQTAGERHGHLTRIERGRAEIREMYFI